MKILLFSIAFLLTTSFALATIGKADESDEYRAVQNISPYLPGNLTAGQALEKATVYGLDPWEKDQLKNIRASKKAPERLYKQQTRFSACPRPQKQEGCILAGSLSCCGSGK